MTDLCTLADVKLRLWPDGATSDTNADTILNEILAQVTDDLSGYCGRLFVAQSSATAQLFDVENTGRILLVPQGIVSIGTLEVATSSQPDSGGTYSTVTAGQYFLRPLAQDRPVGWPATEIVINSTSAFKFYRGYNTVRATIQLGFGATINPSINAIAINAVVNRYQLRKSGSMNPGAIGTSEFGGPLWALSLDDKRKLRDFAYGGIG